MKGKKKKRRKKRKKVRQKKDRSLNKTRNVSAIISYILVGTSALLVILWYLNILRL